MAGRHPRGARLALGGPRVVGETVVDRRQQGGQRQPGVGGDGKIDRGQRLVRLRPAPQREVVEGN